MKKKFLFHRLFLLLILLFSFNSHLFSQNQDELAIEQDSTKAAQITFGVDLMSRYIWRGMDYGNSPAIQPNVGFSVNGFKIGVWGSYGIAEYKEKVNDSTTVEMGHYAEFDLFAAYTWKWFTIGVTDYFIPNGLQPNSSNKYYNYKNSTTGHALEASLFYNGTEKLPLQICVCTLFYGADKGKDALGEYGKGNTNNYSTYIEASYQFNIKKAGIGVKPFIGGIPFGSDWYGNNAGIVNIGFTASKSIKITNDFSLPVNTSVITNPQAQSVFLVFGLTL